MIFIDLFSFGGSETCKFGRLPESVAIAAGPGVLVQPLLGRAFFSDLIFWVFLVLHTSLYIRGFPKLGVPKMVGL